VSFVAQPVAQGLEKEAREDDPVDDREVAGRRVGGGRVGDDPHHGLVLLS
jgi:hypothetical protein